MSINRKGGSKPGPEREIRPPKPPPRNIVQTPEGLGRQALGRQVLDLQTKLTEAERKLSEAETFVLRSLVHEREHGKACHSFCKRCALIKILKEESE